MRERARATDPDLKREREREREKEWFRVLGVPLQTSARPSRAARASHAPTESAFRCSGFWFRVLGFGFLVSDLGFRVLGFGFRVWGLGFGVWGFGFGVCGLGFGVWGLGFRGWGFGFRVRLPQSAQLGTGMPQNLSQTSLPIRGPKQGKNVVVVWKIKCGCSVEIKMWL